MAKRFTDTNKWENIWFRKLPNTQRWFWIYILDRCNHAGLWEVDFETAEYFTGLKIDREEMETAFSDKIVIISNKLWFIPKFVCFQYKTLSETNKAQNSVIEAMREHGLHHKYLELVDIKGAYKPHASPYLGVQDKDKEKDKDMDKEKDKDEYVFSFDDLTQEQIEDMRQDMAKLGLQK